MDAKIFRVNYKSDFILTLISDAGWMTPFCIKFWTGAPSQAYYAQYDGTTYTNCAPVDGEPTKLTVQFDDHHLPIGDLKYQVAYHFTVADFPNDTEDEVLNQANITTEIDGETYQVMIDFTGETAPEIQFSLPAYANEAQRIANELQRESNELQREANEEDREANELNRQRNEGTRIENEQERVLVFGQMKGDLEQATRDAAAATENANEKAVYAKNRGDYAKQQGDYAKQQGDIAKADHERAEEDHRIAGEDHTQAGSDHTRAGDDHTQAGSDHTRAGDDHTQAGNDHTRADQDHTRAGSDHEAVEVYVDSLGAFDLSKHNAVGGVLATYADLDAALTALNALESKYKYGGMSLKYVQSSDNKYVQARCMAQNFTTDVIQWQGVDDEPTAGSDNLVTSSGVYNNIKNLGHTVPYTLDSTNGFYKKDGTTVDTPGFKRGTATVSANKLIRIVTSLYYPTAALVIKDGNNNIIEYFEGDNTISYKEYSFISPNNGATILFSCYDYDKDLFTLFEYDIVNYVAALNNIDSLQNNENAAEEYVKPIVIDWISGKYFVNSLELIAWSGGSYFEYSNTKVGEKYLIYVSSGYGAFTQGIRNTDNTVYKRWVGEKVDWELIEITEDGQTICLSYYDNAILGRWSYSLMRLGYTKNEDNIKTIQGQIAEIDNSLTQKAIPISFINDGFYEASLTVVTWGSGGAGHFEYSNTHVGERYYIYVSGGTGSFCQGIRNPDNTVYKLWNKVGVDEVVEITQDGQAICLSQYYAENWEIKLSKLTYTKNEDAIQDINKRIGALSSFTSSAASMGVPVVALPNYDYNHIIVYGQSFAVGNGAQGNENNVESNYMLGNTTSATANKDRTALNPLNGAGGGIVIQCANAFNKIWNRNHNSKFIATSGGYGGTTIEELSKGTQYYSDLLTELTSIKAIADNENKSVGCIAVIFVQGESNYAETEGHAYDKSTYKYFVNKFIDDVQGDIQSIYGQSAKPVILMYQTGYGHWLPNNRKMDITMAQIELAKDREDVILGCPTYNVSFNSTSHPSGSGYAMIGETMAKHLYNLMEKNLRSEGTHPIVVSKSGNAVNIGCYALVQPLVVDTHTSPVAANNGFKLYVDGVDNTISSVTVNGSSIVLTSPNSLDGHIVEVAYASKGTDGKGNICDSDSDYMSWQTYINEQNMLQQPYDNDGRSIVGKRLPLQNYLSNFYMNVDFHYYKHLYRLSTSDTQFTPKLYNNTSLSVTFTTSDSSVVTVTDAGSITPVSVGYAIIKASVTKDSTTWTDEILVIVE